MPTPDETRVMDGYIESLRALMTGSIHGSTVIDLFTKYGLTRAHDFMNFIAVCELECPQLMGEVLARLDEHYESYLKLHVEDADPEITFGMFQRIRSTIMPLTPGDH